MQHIFKQKRISRRVDHPLRELPGSVRAIRPVNDEGQVSSCLLPVTHVHGMAHPVRQMQLTGACFQARLQNDITGAIIRTVNTATKLLNAMRHNPNDWAMAKLLTVAKQHGLEVRSTGGSHHVFSHPSVKDSLSVPAHRPIKAIYIKRFVALIDQIED